MNFYSTPVLLRGYHPDHNPARDYKTAKTPIATSTGFTEAEYNPPTPEEITTWTSKGGVVGHLVPEGGHILFFHLQGNME